MVTNPEVKAALIKKLGISQSAMYALAKRKYHALYKTMVAEAIYVLALDSGVSLKKALDPEAAERIRKLHLEYNSSASTTVSPVARTTGRKTFVTKSRVYKIPYDDPLLTNQIRRDAEAMANVYPLFYYLENSIRSFVCTAMKKYCGEDWWDQQVKSDLRNKVKGLKETEHKNMWHQKRGDREVDYLDFKELKNVYSKIRARLVKDKIFSPEYWLDRLIDEVYASRCVIAHMNPLDADSIQAVKVKAKQWNKLIKAKYQDLL